MNGKAKGIKTFPEILVSLVGAFKYDVFKVRNDSIPFLIGPMIEVSRTALTADLIAQRADFFPLV